MEGGAAAGRSGSVDADNANERDRRGCTGPDPAASRPVARRTVELFLLGIKSCFLLIFISTTAIYLVRIKSPPSCIQLHSSPATAGEIDRESPEQFSSQRMSSDRLEFSREPEDCRRASPGPMARSIAQSLEEKALSTTLAAAAAGRSWRGFGMAPSSEPIERP